MTPSPTARRVALVLAGLLLWSAGSPRADAQELACRVDVDYTQLAGNDFDFLQDLEQQISEYLNEHAWTEDRFEDVERIDCSVQMFVLEAPTLTSFRARLVLASRRPIYGTAVSSTVLQVSDTDFEFGYARGTPLVHDPERYDPLASVLDFYALIILGYDYDTFSPLGGTPYFERARRIANIAQSQNAAGWSQLGGDRGRANLVSQLLDPRFQPLRRAYSSYYLSGLDRFVRQPDASRQTIFATLQELETLYDELSRQYALDLFFSANAKELADLFDQSQLSSQAYDLLSAVDPSNLTLYNQLVN